MRRIHLALAVLGLLALAPAVRAQEAGLTELYGHAVHAFFSGRTQASLESLTQAIDAGSQDPRVFYYRGLVWQQMQSPEAAEQDFARGAALEASGQGLYGVDRALERIQGRTRLVIEHHRTAARLAALRALAEERARYNQEIESTRPEITVPPGPPATRPAVPLEQPVQPAAPPPAPGESAPRDPLNAPMQNPPAEAEEAAPVQPAPGQPAPVQPAPVQPAPGQPAPEQPAPTQVDPFKEDDPFKETANP